jgi:hypothetical protein
MTQIRLLKADVRECGHCHGHGCQRCERKGYRIIDRSYTVNTDTLPNGLYYERKANLQCVRCGSAELVTTTLCGPCRALHAERMHKSRSKGEL